MQSKFSKRPGAARDNPNSYHGVIPRGLEAVPRSVSYDGRFGRMFRDLPGLRAEEEDLLELADTMIEPELKGKALNDSEDPSAPSNNKSLPAGYTYLGQFIDHDLTFDPTSQLQRDNDPEGLQNFRTPRFDLDSIYGRGPKDSSFLYDGNGRFALAAINKVEEDLPRNEFGRAIIGDPPKRREFYSFPTSHCVFEVSQ